MWRIVFQHKVQVYITVLAPIYIVNSLNSSWSTCSHGNRAQNRTSCIFSSKLHRLKLCLIHAALCILSTIYNMSGRVVSDIQTRAEGESLYIRYNTDANVVNDLKNDSSYEFIGEVILKINVV
jgi:hypothetical protein